MPRIPSLPMNSFLKSGPVAVLGCGFSSIMSPGGTAIRSPSTMSSIPPYLVENWPIAFVAIQPPRVDGWRDWGI